jgi:glycine oxidase
VSKAFDVAVVGAGVVGAAIAYECASRGARVVLLDRDQPGAHASGAAAGMLAPCSEAHQAGPFLDLARESCAMWPLFAGRVREDGGVDPELSVEGLLRVAVDAEAANEVRERLRWQHDAGIAEGEWVDAAEARELEPALRSAVEGAAWYPHEGHVHSRHAVRAMVAAAAARGAEVTAGAEVVGPLGSGASPNGTGGRIHRGSAGDTADRRAHGVRLRDGTEIAARHVVLAPGAWLAELSAAFGCPLPVRPVHGQLVALANLPRAPRRVLFAGLLGYVVAKRDGTVLAGATEEDRGFDATPHAEATTKLLATATRLLDGAERATVTHAWAGLRPAAPDRLPLLGPLGDSPDVVVAGAHYRNGVLLAPATARGIATMLLDGTTPSGWSAFDPHRHPAALGSASTPCV